MLIVGIALFEFAINYFVEPGILMLFSPICAVFAIEDYADSRPRSVNETLVGALKLYSCIVCCLIAQFAAIDLRQLQLVSSNIEPHLGRHYFSITAFALSIILSIASSYWVKVQAQAPI